LPQTTLNRYLLYWNKIAATISGITPLLSPSSKNILVRSIKTNNQISPVNSLKRFSRHYQPSQHIPCFNLIQKHSGILPKSSLIIFISNTINFSKPLWYSSLPQILMCRPLQFTSNLSNFMSKTTSSLSSLNSRSTFNKKTSSTQSSYFSSDSFKEDSFPGNPLTFVSCTSITTLYCWIKSSKTKPCLTAWFSKKSIIKISFKSKNFTKQKWRKIFTTIKTRSFSIS
jgi:hypothetical protein